MRNFLCSALLATCSLMGGQVAFGEEPEDQANEERDRNQCYKIQQYARDLYDELEDFERLVKKYEHRSQLEFALGNAQRSVGTLFYQAQRTQCAPRVMRNALEGVRDRLDVVRNVFRDDRHLSSKPDLFKAFRQMVKAWEDLRDSITLGS